MLSEGPPDELPFRALEEIPITDHLFEVAAVIVLTVVGFVGRAAREPQTSVARIQSHDADESEPPCDPSAGSIRGKSDPDWAR